MGRRKPNQVETLNPEIGQDLVCIKSSINSRIKKTFKLRDIPIAEVNVLQGVVNMPTLIKLGDQGDEFFIKSVLDITQTHKGKFCKAKVNGNPISKEEFFKITGIERGSGRTLEHLVEVYENSNPEYQVKFSELDVS